MSVKFFLATPKAARSSIDVIVRTDGKRYKKGIGASVDTDQWHPERQRARVTQRYREGAVINHKIEEWDRAISNVLFEIGTRSIEVKDPSEFWKRVDCERQGVAYSDVERNPFFSDYFEKIYIPRFSATKSESRIQRFTVVIHKIQAYETSIKRKLTFDDINTVFYRDFMVFMNERHHSANYFGTIIKIIKQVMLEAQNIDKLHLNDAFRHSDFKATTFDVDTVYLSMDELERIFSTTIDSRFTDEFYPRLHHAKVSQVIQSYNIVKNRFLIGAYTGLRISDFNRLSASNVKDKFISIVTDKTGQKVVIPIHPNLQAILDDGFDLSLSLSDAKTNRYIKDICKYVKITEEVEYRECLGGKIEVKRCPKYERVSSHTARRSFATNAYLQGVPSISIMKLTGHTTERMFMRYIRVTQEENAAILAEHDFFKK